jgi:NhaA family Na+:H+ antiporter
VLALLNRFGVVRLAPYLVVGALLWLSVLKSGVHATIAGVVIGTMIPRRSMPKLEHALHPWVTFGIMPLFALANAGASLEGVGLHTFTEPVALGIVLGLFLGKQFGVFAACWLAVRSGLAQLPVGSNWVTLHGVAILTGIGFTMSLFVRARFPGRRARHCRASRGAGRLDALRGHRLRLADPAAASGLANGRSFEGTKTRPCIAGIF